ncbi:MAG TPA: hypothetical protein VN179_01635 [Solirubrobacterales bacterium]|nr:hypothetical protein [Solirubrobacterales bacterium]
MSLSSLVAVLLIALIGVLAVGGGKAQAKTLSGELQCAPGERVSGIWMLGSRSGWHGFNYPSTKRPYTGWYSMTNAVQGETMKTWIRCSVFGEFYSSFTVGTGSTRHICSPGWGPCLSINIGGCAVKLAFTGLNMRTIGCFVRYGR